MTLANPLGFVQANDFGNPQIITGYALEALSGGQFVSVSGADNSLSSGLSTYDSSDIKFYNNDSQTNVGGVVINNAASGAEVAVAVNGLIISRVVETTTPGVPVEVDGAASGVQPVTGVSGTEIGRAYTHGTSGTGYCLVNLRV